MLSYENNINYVKNGLSSGLDSTASFTEKHFNTAKNEILDISNNIDINYDYLRSFFSNKIYFSQFRAVLRKTRFPNGSAFHALTNERSARMPRSST